MDTSDAEDYRPGGRRDAILSAGLAMVAAAPYVAFFVAEQVWPPPDEWPALLDNAVLWGGFLSPFAGLIGCGLGVSSFRKATRNRERVIAIVAAVVSAAAFAAFTVVVTLIAMW